MKDRYMLEIVGRGFETSWQNGYPGDGWSKAWLESIYLIEKKGRMRLYGADSWKKYTRNSSYRLKLRYLSGFEDQQYWAVRVSSGCNTVKESLDWLEPSAVKKARNLKRWVARQGDCYFVELTRGEDNLYSLPSSHKVAIVGCLRSVWHHQHKTVRVPGTVKAFRVYRQTQFSSNGKRVFTD